MLCQIVWVLGSFSRVTIARACLSGDICNGLDSTFHPTLKLVSTTTTTTTTTGCCKPKEKKAIFSLCLYRLVLSARKRKENNNNNNNICPKRKKYFFFEFIRGPRAFSCQEKILSTTRNPYNVLPGERTNKSHTILLS